MDAQMGTDWVTRQFVWSQLASLTVLVRISTLELRVFDMIAQDAERLAEVLAQCPALTRLSL